VKFQLNQLVSQTHNFVFNIMTCLLFFAHHHFSYKLKVCHSFTLVKSIVRWNDVVVHVTLNFDLFSRLQNTWFINILSRSLPLCALLSDIYHFFLSLGNGINNCLISCKCISCLKFFPLTTWDIKLLYFVSLNYIIM
jgi:hypothetical protein